MAQLARGDVGDPTIRTDHPQYAGEGAFQTVEDCVAFATQGQQSPQDRAVAMYLWLLTHQWHLASPQEWCVPGVTPDTRRDSAFDMVVYDANRARFSYGYGLCGTVHAWNEPYWKVLGLNARRRAFPGHVNSEIEYGGAWHAFDTDMAGLVFRRDGVVAGYEDIAKDPQLATNAKPPLPCYPFAWPGDFQTMKAGWEEIAKGGHWYKMYHSGYAAHPGVVHLRPGETFTRYFDRDHFGGPSKRRFWHDLPGGPQRNWTFANLGVPRHEGSESNSRGNASYCNGEFVYRPKLPRDGAGPTLTFDHFSPYVICGDPADDANPMSGPATDGFIVKGKIRGSSKLEVSADEGQTWHAAGEVQGDFRLDLTDRVKGRYGWQARLTLAPGGTIQDLEFTTTTQVCQAIYPRLKPGGSDVVYRAASRAVVPVLPSFGLPEMAAATWEKKSLRSPNVVYSPRTKDARFAYRTTDNKPGTVVFQIDSPSDLTEVSAALRFGVRVPPPPDCDFHLDLSLDGGQSWSLLGEAKIPADNEYSSGWMYGRRQVEPGVRTALVRATFYQGGHQAGLIEAQLYGLRQTAPPQALDLTYAWKEDGAVKQHTEQIAAGKNEQRFRVPTGAAISDEFVRLSVRD
jgi:hypothetical protein